MGGGNGRCGTIVMAEGSVSEYVGEELCARHDEVRAEKAMRVAERDVSFIEGNTLAYWIGKFEAVL